MNDCVNDDYKKLKLTFNSKTIPILIDKESNFIFLIMKCLASINCNIINDIFFLIRTETLIEKYNIKLLSNNCDLDRRILNLISHESIKYNFEFHFVLPNIIENSLFSVFIL